LLYFGAFGFAFYRCAPRKGQLTREIGGKPYLITLPKPAQTQGKIQLLPNPFEQRSLA
jgi:hypothetical protein